MVKEQDIKNCQKEILDLKKEIHYIEDRIIEIRDPKFKKTEKEYLEILLLQLADREAFLVALRSHFISEDAEEKIVASIIGENSESRMEISSASVTCSVKSLT